MNVDIDTMQSANFGVAIAKIFHNAGALDGDLVRRPLPVVSRGNHLAYHIKFDDLPLLSSP